MTTTNRKKIKSGSKKAATDAATPEAADAARNSNGAETSSPTVGGTGMTAPQMFAILFMAIECATLLNASRAARSGVDSSYCTKIFQDTECTVADSYLMVESYHMVFVRVIALSCFVRICWSDDRLLRRLNLCVAAIPLAVSVAIMALTGSELWNGYTRLSLGIRWALLMVGAVAFSWNAEVAQSKLLTFRLQNLPFLVVSTKDSAGTFLVLLAHAAQWLYYVNMRGVQEDDAGSYVFDQGFSSGSLILWYLTLVDKLVPIVLMAFGFLFFSSGGRRAMMIPLCIISLFTLAYHLPRQGGDLQDHVLSFTRLSTVGTTALQIGVLLLL